MEAPKPEEKKQPVMQPLGPTGLESAEYRRNMWIATAAKTTNPQDLEDPNYWAHVAAKLAPWNKVEVRSEDGTWYAEVLVLESSRNWARVCMLPGFPLRLTTADVSQTLSLPKGFEVVHRGPKKWSVVRSLDRAVMHEGEQTKTGALEWLDKNVASLTA